MKKFFRLILIIASLECVYSCKTINIQPSFCISLNGYVPVIKSSTYKPVTRSLLISWDSVLCADQYQLEWTFASWEDTSTQKPNWKPDFRFNSTRIVTPATHYNIPILYEEGTLVYRLRCVKTNNISGQALFSSWSRVFASGTNSGTPNLYMPARFQINSALAHEAHKLNWQYLTNYSDEGTRKENVQYLDGTLRQRQLIIFSNADTLALAENTIYDFNGRAAISTIPAPVIYADSLNANNQYGRHLGYYPRQVLASKDTPYSYKHFDLDQFSVKADSCSPVIIKPRPLSNESGASRYFSSSNNDKSGAQAFTPDGGGFPYIQTQWADDNANRIIKKSSAGQNHFIGSNHEWSFRYADVAQDEIDMLFGNDAGDERYYKKVIKVDANGQMSVEYSRIDGKVVATALAGPIPDNLDSINTQVVPINVDIVGTEQTVGADGLSKFATKTFDLSNNATCSFGYRLLSSNFEKTLCNNQKLCLDCRYRIQLLLRDQNGVVIKQVDTAIGTLQQNCAASPGAVYRNLFTQVLCKGNYSISRTITIDTSGFDSFYQSYMRKADSCGDVSIKFPTPDKITSTCSLTCADCKALPDSLKAGLKDYCDIICNKGFASPCDQSKEMMLINLSPGGQYAQYDLVMGNVDAGKYPLSIYHNGKWRSQTTGAPADLAPYIVNNDLNGLVSNWKSAWAEYFLPLHPEYCYYLFCKNNEPAYAQNKQFNDGILAIPNAKNAVGSKYIEPDKFDPSLTAFNIVAEVKSRMNSFRSGKNIKEFIYSGFLNCKSIPPYGPNIFANTPDTVMNNMQWQMFRALYMSIKSQVIDSLREVFVKNKCGGYCNKCIGDSLYYYSSCNPASCNVPADSICNAFRKKAKLFLSTFSYQEMLPFKLIGVDSLDLAIIQDYTSRQLPKTCKCDKYDQLEFLINYVIGKKKLVGNLLIRDTLCSVGISYETLPGYKGDITWSAAVQSNRNLQVNLYDSVIKRRCSMDFVSVDSLIPWQKIVQVSCLRPNRIPFKFPAGANIFLIDLYDSSFKKYIAEVSTSCIDTSLCKPAKSCTSTCNLNGLEEIFKCGLANGGNSTSISLQDSLIRKWYECMYGAKLSGGNLMWHTTRSGTDYIVTLTLNAVIGNRKLVDSCQYVFDFGRNANYIGYRMEVISIQPDTVGSKNSCKIYGVKMVLAIRAENQPVKYITVYGKPTKDCFPIVDCCKPTTRKCPNEFSNKLNFGNGSATGSGLVIGGPNFTTRYPDTVTAQFGKADTVWARKFVLSNSGYYQFSFALKSNLPFSSNTATILQKTIELRVDDSMYTRNLQFRKGGGNEYIVTGRIPFRYKRFHILQVELKRVTTSLAKAAITAYHFSLVGENCEDCCLPVFPPFMGTDSTLCDSTRRIVDGYNGEMVRSQFLTELRAKLKQQFVQHCLSNMDSFALRYKDALYQFTLFYYDQANNLLTTIPPRGVHLLPPDSVQKVQSHRKNPAAAAVYPNHGFRSDHQFNSLNAITQSSTPDGGIAKNWYDALGRLVVQQQARQSAAGKFNYTLYDRLSRIVQSGEFVKPGANIPLLLQDSIQFVNTLRSSPRYDVNSTFYDQPLVDSINGLTSIFRGKSKFYGDSLNYLRHRVAATTLTDSIPAGSGLVSMNYLHAIHYWYDMHGFVRMLIHELPSFKQYGQTFKRESYDYNLLSGNVKKVKYQQGETDQFFTRYDYDPDIRLMAVYTSLNDSIWERDARYYFNKHRRLARMELGADSVQGLDYVYTIQGLTKSINTYALRAETDPGRDGDSTAGRRSWGVDMFGYEVGYFKNDYTPINTPNIAAALHSSIFDSLRINDGLYNGNIRYVVKGLLVPSLTDKIQASTYAYDQVNRITSSAVTPITINTGYLPRTNASPDYGTSFTYDANGNILGMLRNGTALAGQRAMDALGFYYNGQNNQLQFVTDTVGGNNYSNDIDGSQPGNYQYDLSGNLLKDASEDIDSILWNPRGKIARIIKNGGASTINYSYNSLGHRLAASSKGRTTYYIRDIDGNAIATYVIDSSGLHCKELTIYGSKRIGIFDKSLNGNSPTFVKGNKRYELTDHLDNVLLTISDKKIPHDTNGDGIVNYYTAEIVTASDYYPFGMEMPLRTVNDSAYRFGFNGKEKDDEVKGRGNQLDFGSRIYDSRLGRFLSIDPAANNYPFLSPYASSGNNPILYIDKEGQGPDLPPKEIVDAMKKNHPIEYKALLGANNTSPKKFWEFVKNKGRDKEQFYTFKGVFGEAELYTRATTGEQHLHGESEATAVSTGQFGQYFKKEQVDVQQRALALYIPGLVEISGGLHYSNVYGNEKFELLGEGENTIIVINYEVKTISPNNDPESNYRMLAKGVQQARDRTSRENNIIGVLVTDEEVWMNLLTNSAYTGKVQKLYEGLIEKGARLHLSPNLENAAVARMWRVYEDVKEAEEERKKRKKKKDED